jgi:hypothetical protein
MIFILLMLITDFVSRCLHPKKMLELLMRRKKQESKK